MASTADDDDAPLPPALPYAQWCEGVALPAWVRPADSADKPGERETWLLEVTEERGAPANRVALTRYTTVLGSGARLYRDHCHVLVQNEDVGLCHAAVALNPASCGVSASSSTSSSRRNQLEFHLIDLNSTAGTVLNGVALGRGACTRLKVGDKFSLGEDTYPQFRLMRGGEVEV